MSAACAVPDFVAEIMRDNAARMEDQIRQTVRRRMAVNAFVLAGMGQNDMEDAVVDGMPSDAVH